MTWPVTTRRNGQGVLEFGGVAVTNLAAEFGTPLYVFDEATLRDRARRIRTIFMQAYPRSEIVYAGKAYLSPALMAILIEEGIGLDVVSGGEIFAGMVAGVDPARMIFHGNNKSRCELNEAVTKGVGLIAVDNESEIGLLDEVSQELRQDVRVVLRLNPGVDPHTHQKMRTGAADSKFGFPIQDGQAAQAAETLRRTRRLNLIGYHAHVGSQIFDSFLVEQTVGELMRFAASMRDTHAIAPEVIIPGGGFGVADDASGIDADIGRWATAMAAAVRSGCQRFGLAPPRLIVEPGRAIIGPSGVAVYEVGSRKAITEGRTYVSVDGGMADNIRPSLYGARYTAGLANRDGAGDPEVTVAIAGKYCESGDVLIESISLPQLRPGDLLAMPMTGAYCLAMASNYNLAPRPAAVLVNNGHARIIRRRESYEDMLRCEVYLRSPDGEKEAGRLSTGKVSV